MNMHFINTSFIHRMGKQHVVISTKKRIKTKQKEYVYVLYSVHTLETNKV